MQAWTLLLYSRQGCCLCQGLEQRMSELALDQLQPPLTLRVIDIDDLTGLSRVIERVRMDEQEMGTT